MEPPYGMPAKARAWTAPAGHVRPLHPQGQDQGPTRRRLVVNDVDPPRRGRDRGAERRPQGFLACTQSSKPCAQAPEPRAQGSPPGARAPEPRPRSSGALLPEYRAPRAGKRWAGVPPVPWTVYGLGFKPCIAVVSGSVLDISSSRS